MGRKRKPYPKLGHTQTSIIKGNLTAIANRRGNGHLGEKKGDMKPIRDGRLSGAQGGGGKQKGFTG